MKQWQRCSLPTARSPEPTPIYELNNLVWLARASMRWRWVYALRAVYLATCHQEGRRRLKEYAVLIIGGETLYSRIRARRA